MRAKEKTIRARIRRAILVAFMSAVILGAHTGCALFSADRRDGGESSPPTSPLIEAHERAQNMVEEARQEGLQETERERSYVVKVRYNPGRCGAPNDEVFAYGSWQRVALVGRSERVELNLEEWRARAQDEPLRHQKIEGRWDEREWVAASGVVWPVFRVDSLLEVESAQNPFDKGEGASSPRTFASFAPCIP